ncbi:MAG: tetratricopeptide repeat protein [Spirochaetota bacterium]
MDKSARLLIVTSLGVYLLSFAVFAVYSLQQFPGEGILDQFYVNWVLANAFGQFVDRLIPIQAFAVALAFSLFAGHGTRQPRGRFFDLVRPALIVVLVSGFVYTLVVGFAEPAVADARQQMEYRSELARDLLNAGNEAYEQQDWNRAVTEYQGYLAIDSENAEIEDRLAEARRRGDESDSGREATEEDFSPGYQVTEQDAESLMERAREAMSEEDYISAHYWARIALDLDPERPEAQRMVQRAREQMASPDLSDLDEREVQLFEQKREAYTAWRNDELFRAYNMFSEVAEEYPRDRDVRRYLPEVENAVRNVAFLTDEIGRTIHRPGTTDILFMDDAEVGSGERTIVAIDRLVTTGTGTYARGIEAMEIGADGETLFHVQAPYGKFREGRFLLQGIDPGGREPSYRPNYLVRPEGEQPLPALEVEPSPQDLHMLGDSGPSFESASVEDLLVMADLYPQVGYSDYTVHLALGMRLLLPFSFIIVSFFSISIGWTWRKRYISRPPLPVIVLIPVIPVVLAVVAALYHYLHRVIIGTVLLAGGFPLALVVIIVVQAVLLFVALAVLAGQSAS